MEVTVYFFADRMIFSEKTKNLFKVYIAEKMFSYLFVTILNKS